MAFLLAMLMKINYAFVNHGPIPSWFLSKMAKMVVFENGPFDGSNTLTNWYGSSFQAWGRIYDLYINL